VTESATSLGSQYSMTAPLDHGKAQFISTNIKPITAFETLLLISYSLVRCPGLDVDRFVLNRPKNFALQHSWVQPELTFLERNVE
jgi:hypothetical protein